MNEETMVNAPEQAQETKSKDSERRKNTDKASVSMSCADRTDTGDKHQSQDNNKTEKSCDINLVKLSDDLGQLGLDKEVKLPELPDLGTGPPNESRPGVRNLRSWLNKNIKVEISDGRFLVGTFLCTDRDSNVIIGMCNEYTRDPDIIYNQSEALLGRETADKESPPNPELHADSANSRLTDSSKGCEADLNTVDEGRILGLAMVPGRHIKKLYIDESPYFPTSSRVHHNSGSEESCQSA